MRFLLTRPQEDGAAFAAVLTTLGHTAVVAPLSRVEFTGTSPLDMRRFAGILASSANGVRALARRTDVRDLPLLAVGQQTAAAAISAGFAAVFHADGDATDLARAVAAHFDPGARLFWGCAAAAQTLSVPGYGIERFDLYRAVAVDDIPPVAREALQTRALDGVFVFSPHSGAVLRRLVVAGGLVDFCRPLAAYCISQAAAKMLIPLAFAQICIASCPNRAAMLDMVRNK